MAIEGRSFPTELEKRQALTALEAFRDRKSNGAKVDNTAAVDAELLELAEVANEDRLVLDGTALTWGALSKRIRDLGKTKSKHVGSTVRVVQFLLAWSNRREGHSSHPPRGTGLVVNCPEVIFEHRAVIVGQLPHFDPRTPLYPAVFVKPHDGNDHWYPQTSRHNPLLADRAFACLAHFGNPGAIWHRRQLPMRFDVRVYALRKPWTDRARTTLAELNSQVNALRDPELSAHELDFVERTGDHDVIRHAPAIHDIRISHTKGEIAPTNVAELECETPFSIQWKGAGGARLEIRAGDDDGKVWEDAVASGVTFQKPGDAGLSAPQSGTTLCAGHYRFRLYPHPSFLDPQWEWWLKVT